MSNESERINIFDRASECVDKIFNIAANEIGDEEKSMFSDIKGVLPKLYQYVSELESLCNAHEKLQQKSPKKRSQER